MKKICLVLVLASMFVSCQKEDSGTLLDVINLEVRQSDWSIGSDIDGLNSYYYCEFTIPDITSYVYSVGSVQVYIVKGGVQQVLPYVRHYENADGALWTQTIDADFATGNLIVYVTNSDFYQETPPAMKFRVVLMW